MILLYPIFLLLALPLAVSLWAWGFRSRWLLGLRIVTLLLIVAALAGVTVRLPSQAGTVIAIADRSHSLPADAEAAQKDLILLLEESMSADDRLGVVSFGRNVAVEHAPERGKFTGFAHEIGRDASNLTEAIEMGLSLIPRGAPGRLVIASDGQWTGRDPAAVAVRAAERGIALDFRVLQRNIAQDVAIVRIDAPSSVNPGESYLITAWVYSSGPDEIAYDLRRGGEPLAAGKRTLEAGLNRLAFRDQATEPGTNVYSLHITPKSADAIPENNAARFLVGIGGPRSLLVVTSSPESGFPDLLKAGGLRVKAASPEACTWTLEELSKYSGVILENVPADKIGHNGMETLAAWVEKTGAGLMVTGGRASFGPGGYYKSPLDKMLPVSMELRQEHRKLSLAMVVALDRSGSMAVPVGGGRVKMDLANLGAAQVVDLLSPTDEFGCIAVDSAPHVIHDLSLITDKAGLRNRILRINSEGGGIFVYEALEASYAMLQKAKAGTRHIILFSDAADAEEPKQYEKLLAQCRAESITVSVIGLGKETDKDGQLLKDIAAKGMGRVFFTEHPEELPRLFAQDTFVVARSAFLDEPTPIKTTAGLATITSKQYQPPQLGGYNLCYLRPQATLSAVSLDDYSAPVVASWQAGAGRVLCYTGEVDGKYTGAMAGWKDIGDFLTSLARWTASRDGALPGGAVLTQERQKGIATIKLLLDPDRPGDLLSTLPEVSVLRATGAQKPKDEKIRMTWTGADSLAIDVPLYGTETALAAVAIPGHGVVPLPPVCLPYSPEYEPPPTRTAPSGKNMDAKSAARWGPPALEELGRMTGGRERVELGNLWKELPRHPRLIPLAPWLLVAACATLLLEVLQRLTGALSQRRLRRPGPTAVSAAPEPASPAVALPPSPSRPASPPSAAPAPIVPPALAPAAPSSEGLLEALRQVQKKKRPRP